jgi:radical SAM-linked protein
LRYGKRGKPRFVSAIDMGRIWERSIRKAALPIAYSEGFSPHPKISFPDALPLGLASTGEYAELTFAVAVALRTAMTQLDAALPDGIDVLDAVAADEDSPKLAKLLAASLWQVDYPAEADLHAAVDSVDAAATLLVDRERKGERVAIDVRPALAGLAVSGAWVRALIRHIEPLIRPAHVDLALRRYQTDLPAPDLVTRIAQGQIEGQGLTEALSGEHIQLSLLSQRQPT